MEHPKISNSDGVLRLNFGDYGQEVDVAAIAGDGSRLLAVREVGVANIWDIETSELVAEIRPNSPLAGSIDASPMGGAFEVFIESAALSRDGSYALLGLNDGTAVVYQVDRCKLLSVLHPPGEDAGQGWGVIRSVMYSEENLALVGFSGRRVGVWSADGCEQIAFLESSAERLVGRPFVRDTLISSVGLSRDGRYVFAGGVDMTATIFDIETGGVVFEAHDHAETIVSLIGGPNGVVWATTGGAVWAQDKDKTVTKRLDTGDHWAEVAFDPSATTLLARSYDGQITRWGLDGHRADLVRLPQGFYHSIPDHARTLHVNDELAYFPEAGDRLAVIKQGQKAIIETGSRLIQAEWIEPLNAIAIRDWGNALRLWDVETGALIRSFACPGGCGSFSFSPDAALVALGEIGKGGGLYPRAVYVYETASGKRLHELDGHQWQIQEVAFSPDGRWLASLGDDLLIWETEHFGEPALHRELCRQTRGLVYNDSALLVFEDGQTRVFVGVDECLVFPSPISLFNKWSISADGKWLLVSGTQAAQRFNLSTGQLESTIEAVIPRYDQLIPPPIGKACKPKVGAALWRTAYGDFLHQSDGPRGWIQPLHLLGSRVVVPCESGAVVFETEHVTKANGSVLFEGMLRASCIVGQECLMVNERGQLFRAQINAS